MLCSRGTIGRGPTFSECPPHPCSATEMRTAGGSDVPPARAPALCRISSRTEARQLRQCGARDPRQLSRSSQRQGMTEGRMRQVAEGPCKPTPFFRCVPSCLCARLCACPPRWHSACGHRSHHTGPSRACARRLPSLRPVVSSAAHVGTIKRFSCRVIAWGPGLLCRHC